MILASPKSAGWADRLGPRGELQAEFKAVCCQNSFLLRAVRLCSVKAFKWLDTAHSHYGRYGKGNLLYSIHHERISIIWLINIPITSRIYLFLVRHLSSTHLSKFRLHNRVLSTPAIMFHVRSSDLIHLVAERLSPFANFSFATP